MPYPTARFPTLFQKDSFCLPKGLVLVHKRTPFGVQKESFYNPKGVHFQSSRFLLENQPFINRQTSQLPCYSESTPLCRISDDEAPTIMSKSPRSSTRFMSAPMIDSSSKPSVNST